MQYQWIVYSYTNKVQISHESMKKNMYNVFTKRFSLLENLIPNE